MSGFQIVREGKKLSIVNHHPLPFPNKGKPAFKVLTPKPRLSLGFKMFFFLESCHPSPQSVSAALAAPDLASSWEIPAPKQPAAAVGAEKENLTCSTSNLSPGDRPDCLPPAPVSPAPTTSQGPQLLPVCWPPCSLHGEGAGKPSLHGTPIPPVGPEFSSQTTDCAQGHPALPRLLPTP